MNLIKEFINSLIGQFFIGGLTVSGIAFASNHINQPAIAGLIAAVPIGMPSTIFVDDNRIADYSYNLLIMTLVLFLSTFTNWFFINRLKFNKYKSVTISLLLFLIVGSIIAFINKK